MSPLDSLASPGPYLAAGGAALVLSAALVPAMKALARRTGVVDLPGGGGGGGGGDRKDHAAPTPLLGGAALFLAFAAVFGGGLAVLALAPGSAWLRELAPSLAAEAGRAGRAATPAAALLGGAVVAFAVGLVDDRLKGRSAARGLGPAAKLGGHLVAAGIAVAGGVRSDLPIPLVANAALSVVWIVAIANAFNFLDNMDGLTAGVGLNATAIFGAVALVQGQYLMALALAALAGATLGFLVYNVPPASVYIGDSGATALGFLLGGLTLLESYVTRESPGLVPVLLPPIVLALPLFDMASVVAIRLRAGRPIWVGDRNHLSHRLVRLGMTRRQAVLSIYLLTFVLGAGALLLPAASTAGALMILGQALATVGLVAILMFFGGRGRA